MIDLSLSISDFPTIEGRQSVTWAPVFLSPIVGSPERLVLAIAVASENGGVVCSAGKTERLRCLYGDAADFIIATANGAINDLANLISKHGEKVLLAENFHLGPISTGTPTQSTAKDMRSLAGMWLRSISSLHDGDANFVLEKATEQQARASRTRGDRLPFEVLKMATDRKSPIVGYFRKLALRTPARVPLASVAIDFEGKRTIANFGKLRPMHNMRAEFDRIRSRLWALDVNQVRAGHLENDAVQYELILERPKLSDFSDGGRKVKVALDELANQADEKKLAFRQFGSAAEMLDHLEKREAA